jgi:DeoR/GlpR family transcriptional regulator of sugar metabolism
MATMRRTALRRTGEPQKCQNSTSPETSRFRAGIPSRPRSTSTSTGTTAAAMAPYLVDKEHLTIVTNGLATCSDLHRFMSASATIIAVGGILRPVSSTFVGPVAERFFQDFHVNKLFLSATGLTLEAGVTDPNMLETQVKKAMISASSQVILLMDSSKCHVKSLMTVLPVHEIDILVIDQECPPDLLQKLQARGVDVRIAPALPVENARP